MVHKTRSRNRDIVEKPLELLKIKLPLIDPTNRQSSQPVHSHLTRFPLLYLPMSPSTEFLIFRVSG